MRINKLALIRLTTILKRLGASEWFREQIKKHNYLADRDFLKDDDGKDDDSTDEFDDDYDDIGSTNGEQVYATSKLIQYLEATDSKFGRQKEEESKMTKSQRLKAIAGPFSYPYEMARDYYPESVIDQLVDIVFMLMTTDAPKRFEESKHTDNLFQLALGAGAPCLLKPRPTTLTISKSPRLEKKQLPDDYFPGFFDRNVVELSRDLLAIWNKAQKYHSNNNVPQFPLELKKKVVMRLAEKYSQIDQDEYRYLAEDFPDEGQQDSDEEKKFTTEEINRAEAAFIDLINQNPLPFVLAEPGSINEYLAEDNIDIEAEKQEISFLDDLGSLLNIALNPFSVLFERRKSI